MKLRLMTLLLALLTSLLLVSIVKGQSDPTDEPLPYQTLTISEFADILDHHASEYTIVNVHIPYEGEVPETDLHIPYNDVAALTTALPNKDAPIILYCRSGRMSAEASQVLSELGYTQIWDVPGGMNDWRGAGYEILDNPPVEVQQDTSITLSHIHGLGFSADGSQLFVPAHDGFRVYADGVWITPELPVHDYMGYSPTNEGFYSSGHPGLDSDLVNPLGLIKSEDQGASFTTLAFSGESDFHLMAAGYESHVVYVVNPQPNSALGVGLFYTLDDGDNWEVATAEGINSGAIQLAAHPTESNIVAVATETGLFLSTDHGNEFTLIGEELPATAVTFDPQTGNLYFGYQTLYHYSFETEEIEELAIPEIADDDALAYIAFSPATDHVALADYGLNIYLSADNGQTWEQIARQGAAIHSAE